MHRWIRILLLILPILLLIEFYAYQAIKTTTRKRWIRRSWVFIHLFIYGYFFYVLFTLPRNISQTQKFQWAYGMLITVLLPKLLIFLLLFTEDIIRLLRKIISFFSSDDVQQPLAGRRKFISQIALGFAAIPFAGLIYGIVKGRYNFKVLKYELAFKDLPDAFDGFTITQFSDVHSGSFTNQEKVQYGVDLINEQQSDLLLFTGDIVNNKAEEMNAWIPMFKKLKASYGKFSVLGNHDYGDYVKWNSLSDKKANFEAIKQLHPKIGFELLLNEHRYIEKDGQKIALIGVENWGKKFHQFGDLQKASEGIALHDFKIVMSHDPSHWEYIVKNEEVKYHLTLSGHTHGFQMGIDIPGIVKWSPIQYVYKQWAGIYKHLDRVINVNRGFGYLAFPGRVGIWPEITVITLKKRS